MSKSLPDPTSSKIVAMKFISSVAAPCFSAATPTPVHVQQLQ